MARIKVWNGTTWDYVGNDISGVVTEGGVQTLTNKTIDASQLVDASITSGKVENETLNRPLAFAHCTAGTPSTQSGTIVFRDEVVDTDSCYNHTTGIFTCPKAGIYYVSFSGFTDTGTATGDFFIRKNSTNTYRGYHTTGNGYISVGLVGMLVCAVNDTISIYTGVTLHTSLGGQFAVQYMGTA